ncbi:LOW QUALITY PROTEIN: integrin alpha-6 [Micropterus salmoides]|uniref:LOW QUALITY PROTEIN: integrin alpha-6 n=1 Tax=Micropterus salmoides TaxID=27706 RepID=UPI0018EA692E|nr:LOW QUALITY PROTEIN: integrin alpha-6 [Micropterus salmoides]
MLLQGGHSAVSLALLFYFNSLEPTLVLAFNLDTSHVIRKEGEPGSLFGFSLAMHRQLNPDKRMLLIGAPRARSLGKQAANITGGLYKCEITQSNECQRVEFDNEENVRVENKENQWMGVTVQSQGPGGKIVTCAHRYQRRLYVNTPQESRDITGRCYVLSQDLTIEPSSDEDGGNWNFCEGRTRGHEMFGSCQQGLAATFTKDYHYVVFGAPGAYNWKGIVRVEQKNNTLLEMGVYDDGPYEVGDEHLLNPELVPLPANSYLGFSLDTGHSITRSRDLTVVAGAPRARHSGAVVLLKKDSEASGRLLVEHTLHGPGLASSFGYDVAVVDLNGDGWQDIVVGAPQFFMKDRDIGGAVYVYINQAGRWERTTPVRLNGTKDSMFGLAVENIGDINQDSYEDIAIGAPYGDGGVGQVYIYHGSAQGIKTNPAQILSGKEHNLQLFGYSLAGNMDLDSNSYPDVAVGSLSDTALIYRARPVISIMRDVKISPQEIDLTIKTCGNSICFTVDACFTYKANPGSYNPRLTISYSVEADGNRRKQGLPSRVVFLNNSRTDIDYQFNGTSDLHGQKQETCIKIVAKLKDSIKDKMRSIPIEVSAEIVGTKRQKTRNGLPQLMPILDSSQSGKDIIEVNFVKEGCGRDQICQSNLKMEYKLYYKQNNLEEYSPLPIKKNIPVFHLNYERKDLALRVTVNNMNGDDAYEAKLVGNFPDTLSYSGVRSHQPMIEKPITCTANQNGSQADCELGNPFKRDSEATFYIILSTVGVTLDTTEINIDLQVQTTSVQENISPVKVKAKVIIELPLSVTGEASPNQVSFGGVVKGESAMKTEEEVGSLIKYTFKINNLWKSLKSSVKASLHIQWPKWNKDGKWLLYLLKVTATGQQDILCTPEFEINPLKHIQESSVSRTKREIGERKPRGKKFSLSDKKNVLTCDNEIKCVELRCPLQGLDGTAVELRSRLWNSTFIEDYASLSHMYIVVKASLVLHTQAKNMILRTPDTDVTVAVSPESAVAQHSGVPWWIILVAVLAGILILALLVFLLWKCGFFKRSKQDDSVPRYHAVRIRKETPEYKDGKLKLDPSEKKQWMTTWIDNESYS